MLWSKTGRGSYMPTPLIHDGLLYVLANQGLLDAYDLRSGADVYRQRIPHEGSGFSASPVAADGRIYLSSEDGDIFVVRAGRDVRDPRPLSDGRAADGHAGAGGRHDVRAGGAASFCDWEKVMFGGSGVGGREFGEPVVFRGNGGQSKRLVASGYHRLSDPPNPADPRAPEPPNPRTPEPPNPRTPEPPNPRTPEPPNPRTPEPCGPPSPRTPEPPKREAFMIDDLWYKNAIIYCLDVEKYLDSNGDGIGDFAGLTRKLDYLAGLGVTCVWLQPFYPSPNNDNGYDVSDFYGVHPKHGTLGEFTEFMNHAEQLGMRVIVDLVVNHTSIRHPWFQAARKDPSSPYRDWYVWSKKRPPNWNEGMVFPGVQKATWTRDPVAGEYYFHRFYDFQPDLNTMQSRGARRDHAHHGLLAAAGRLGLPHGRGAVPDRAQGRRRRAAEGLRAAARDARLPAVAAARRGAAGRGQRRRRTRASSTSASWAIACS